MKKIVLFFIIVFLHAQLTISQNKNNVHIGTYVHQALFTTHVDYSSLKNIQKIMVGNDAIDITWHDAYLIIHYTPSVTYFVANNGNSYTYLDFLENGNDGFSATVTATWRVPNSNKTFTYKATITRDEFHAQHDVLVSPPIFPDNKEYFGASCKMITDSGGKCTRAELANRGFAPQLEKLEFTNIKLSLATYVDDRVGKLKKRGDLIEQATVLKASGNCEEAIPLYKEALRLFATQNWLKQNLGLKDADIQFEIDQCTKNIQENVNEKQVEELVGKAQQAENDGNLEKAKQYYQEATGLTNNPNIQNHISEIDKKIEAKKTAENPSQENHPAAPTQLDFWGNPVKGNKAENTTVAYSNLQVQNNSAYQQQMQIRQENTNAKAAWEQKEAEKRQAVDAQNNAIMQQGNSIYQQSLNVDKDMNEALSKISPEAYGDPKALIRTGMGILSTANGNLSKAYAGAAVSGVGIAAGILDDLSRAKAKREAAAERNRIRKENEAKKQAIREAFKKARLSIFKGFPEGKLPLSTTPSKGSNLYYFVYAYNDAELTKEQPQVYLSNVFAIGKYPDGTWPMKDKITNDIALLTPLKETTCGPFYSLQEANTVKQSFSTYLDKTSMASKPINYKGYNAHSETEATNPQSPQLDFWGNPIKN